jgi:hypothetical protein
LGDRDHEEAAEKVVKNIRRKTRQTYSAEEKIRIVLAGLRGEESISVLSQKVLTTDTPKPECLTNHCRRRDMQCS